MSSETSAAIQSSRADVWYLKDIGFRGQKTKIITQAFNGPCSFIAICNILILRGDIEILPEERTTVSYDFMSQLVANYLLVSCPDVDVSAALSIMPLTQKGMDLNPLFSNTTSFRPAGEGGELKLFEQAGIKLVHGWLVDPDSVEAAVLAKTPDYDSCVNLIALADYTSMGQLVSDSGNAAASSSHAGQSSPPRNLTPEDQQRIEDAIVVQQFLDNTQSQLTYHGLFHLPSVVEPETLVALFRNSHLSVLYRTRGEDSSLYTLVTDYVFLHEPSVVWERLEDVDGSSSTFVDSDFIKSTPAGGDVAGYTGESALAALEAQNAQAAAVVDPADRDLAIRLQAEQARELQYLQRQQERRAIGQPKNAAAADLDGKSNRKPKRKVSCIVM